MNVLVACEESQAVCKAFRARGHNAYSCDILECSGGHPEWHFKQDVLQVIPNHGGMLENGTEYYLPEGETWDLMIAHPPCTYLSVSGARWLYHPDDADFAHRAKTRTPSSSWQKKDETGGHRILYGVHKNGYKALGNRKSCRLYEYRV